MGSNAKSAKPRVAPFKVAPVLRKMASLTDPLAVVAGGGLVVSVGRRSRCRWGSRGYFSWVSGLIVCKIGRIGLCGVDIHDVESLWGFNLKITLAISYNTN